MPDDSIYGTQEQIASLFKITKYQVRQFIKLGMPSNKKKIPIIDATHWYVDYLKDNTDNGSTKEIALLINKSERYIQKLVAEKAFPKLEHGRYNKIAFVNKYLELKEEEIKRARGESIIDAKHRYHSVMADLKLLELKEKQKELIPLDIFETFMLVLMKSIEKKIDSLPGRLINKLAAAKNKEQMLQTVKEAVDKIKNDISETQILDPAGDIISNSQQNLGKNSARNKT